MQKQFISIHSKHLNQFIELKRKLGFKYMSEEKVFRQIDSLAYKLKIKTAGITSEFSAEWSKKRPNESDSNRYNRVIKLASFSSFLLDIGIHSHIPSIPRYPQSRFIPHIYSKEELTLIFKASDKLSWKIFNANSPMLAFPCLLRVLYATGIRIGEALSLKDEDVNLEDLFLIVKDSKNGIERKIPISNSLGEVCKSYLAKRRALVKSQCQLFFLNLSGKKINKASPGVLLRRCLRSAAIPYKGRHHGPRIHDFRHTFAVTSLAAMAEAGVDIYTSLPILSTYLGHRSLDSTNHYLRLTAEMYPSLIKKTDAIMLDVFPKLPDHDSD